MQRFAEWGRKDSWYGGTGRAGSDVGGAHARLLALCFAGLAGLAHRDRGFLLALPGAPTYIIPSFPLSSSVIVWAIVAAPIFALGSILYVRLVRWADQGKPRGWQRFIAPAIVLGLLGVVSVRFPQLLG